MAVKKYLDSNGVLYLWSKIKALVNSKVDKVEGKGLSQNDLTNELKSSYDNSVTNSHTHTNKNILDATTASYITEEKNKLKGIESAAEVNKIDSIKTNGSIVPITSKSVDIKVPTKVSELANDSGFLTSHQSLTDYAKKTEIPKMTSQLTNDSNFQTAEQVNGLIASSIGGINSFEVEVLTGDLPASGKTNTIYFKPATSPSESQSYEEYMYVNGKWEFLGTTNSVDLSGYVRESDLIAITNNEIDKIVM